MLVKYCGGDSPLHRLNPLAKLSVVIAFCFSAFLLPDIILKAASLVVILGTAHAIGARQVTDMFLSRFVVCLSVMVLAMQLVFIHDGTVVLSIPLYFFNWDITNLAIYYGVLMALRFLSVVMISALFVATTDPVALVYSLMRAGIPYRYGFMVILALRLATVFQLEATVVGNAQKMRGLAIDEGGVKGMLRSVRYTMLPLIVSALSRVDSLVVSMEGRAFGYARTRTFTVKDRYSPADRALILLSIFAVILVCVLVSLNHYPLLYPKPTDWK